MAKGEQAMMCRRDTTPMSFIPDIFYYFVRGDGVALDDLFFLFFEDYTPLQQEDSEAARFGALRGNLI